MSHQPQQNPDPATGPTPSAAPATRVGPVAQVATAPAPVSPVAASSVAADGPQDTAAAPVLDLRIGGVRLLLEVPARLHVLASGLISSGIAAGLGYLVAHR
ncbi:hypothetical protein ADK60_27985 [Streptomyces sp. XY431]|uniref:hypothetical protein n=1 Tax=Streptomyces sp. XY431 TaxID=1415562 RepID=UPI0006AF1BD7|nr:hypothetical protein [Streptomyces sp. XY431]KOV15451.1 hypothetical protein ADK60_27985 [Streptomyces sp. XY431]